MELLGMKWRQHRTDLILHSFKQQPEGNSSDCKKEKKSSCGSISLVVVHEKITLFFYFTYYLSKHLPNEEDIHLNYGDI